MYKKFNFKEQLSIGDLGESDFKKYYENLKPVKSEDLKYDFLLEDGKTLELKSDSYSLLKTPNFFLESVSDTKSGKLGGPFRAAQDKIDYFVYYFVNDKTFYWFNTQDLFKELEDYILLNKPVAKSISNRGWTTLGFAVPREAFKSVLKVDKF